MVAINFITGRQRLLQETSESNGKRNGKQMLAGEEEHPAKFIFIQTDKDRQSGEKCGYSIPIYPTTIDSDGKAIICNGISTPTDSFAASIREYEVTKD